MKKYSLLFLAASALILGSCKNEEEVTPKPGTLTMHFDSRSNATEDFALDKLFALPNGDSIKISSIAYFISNVQLIKTDGTVYNEPNSYHLIKVVQQETNEEFTLKDIPAGTYSKVRFLVGVDAAHNQTTANAVGDLTPFNFMTWDWNTGYVFLHTGGLYRNPGTTAYNKGFIYEIGKDPCSRWVELAFPAGNEATQIDETHNPEMHLHTYMANIFSGKNTIDYSANPAITGEPKYAALSQQVADNFPGMFRIDHLHTH
jgi:hypothetical protein